MQKQEDEESREALWCRRHSRSRHRRSYRASNHVRHIRHWHGWPRRRQHGPHWHVQRCRYIGRHRHARIDSQGSCSQVPPLLLIFLQDFHERLRQVQQSTAVPHAGNGAAATTQSSKRSTYISIHLVVASCKGERRMTCCDTSILELSVTSHGPKIMRKVGCCSVQTKWKITAGQDAG